jgi:hypothetical protein
VQTEQHQNQSAFPAPIAPAHMYRHAAEHVALFKTHLALTRWTRGGDIPHVFSSRRTVPLRSAWYAQAQRDFQHWLEDGGFHAE